METETETETEFESESESETGNYFNISRNANSRQQPICETQFSTVIHSEVRFPEDVLNPRSAESHALKDRDSSSSSGFASFSQGVKIPFCQIGCSH
jgi:hypothetical protein